MSENDDDAVYWNLKPILPYQSMTKFKVIQQITPKRYCQLYMNTFLGAHLAESFVYPLDVAKTRMHLGGEIAHKSSAKVAKMYRQISNIIHKERFQNLYAGFSAMAIRSFLFNSIRVVLYDVFRTQLIYVDEKTNQEVLTIPSALASGFAAGCIAQVIANPFDIVKVRMQMDGVCVRMGLKPRVQGVSQAFRYIYENGGLPHLWRGVGPSCLRACLMTAGDVGSYDLSKRNFKYYLDLEEGFPLRFLSSMCAGFVASVLSNPADVIKSRIMNQVTDEKGQGLLYKNSLDCALKLINQEGVLSLYKGLFPCWLRLGPWSVLFWVFLEKLREWEGQAGF
ncbi:mitochondrial uncoupling protein 4C [Drosophila tropicalis]|uniref:mitochondrial uncoupling protein 4C n=1 Tax=Drosophila tropicalis TaxID=46794 RepID=UPI0035AB6F1B